MKFRKLEQKAIIENTVHVLIERIEDGFQFWVDEVFLEALEGKEERKDKIKKDHNLTKKELEKLYWTLEELALLDNPKRINK